MKNTPSYKRSACFVIEMNKKKRIINRFTNWLFEEYKVPRIPVKIMYNIDFINDNGVDCFGYYGYDNERIAILVAAKNLGKLNCMFTIAHEFVHYLQHQYGRDMYDKDAVERDAYEYEKALVGKYLINKKHIGKRINSVLNVTVPIEEYKVIEDG